MFSSLNKTQFKNETKENKMFHLHPCSKLLKVDGQALW